jgi:MoaA/NifB/PqqE/SkfB family radical SAM enzyme
LFILAVSLDSPHPEEHNRLRRAPRAFEDALTAIRNASDAGLYTLVSAVIYRRDLTEKNVVELAHLVQQRGAHELRIHQPIPRGKLAHSAEADTIFYKDEDISRLHEMQFAMNNASSGFPKISSLSYTEGPCKFGCGAGVLHSYISATGELWPCDFVPLSFGNVLEEDIAQLYARMRDAVGIPKNCCWARTLAGELADRRLPLDADASLALALADRSSSYPQFFTDLQTVPANIPVPGNGSRRFGAASTATSHSGRAKVLAT